MKRRRVLALVAVVLAAAMPWARAADERVTAEGAHYRLVSSGPQLEADDWLKMLEAAWPQYAQFFGKAPTLGKDEKLNVAFFEDAASMEAAIRKAGGAAPGGEGGYYDPISKTAYAWRQPSNWYTRTLVLHECAHQFHSFARVAPRVSPAAWYVEGIAEHMSPHTWDGEHLRLGVVPMLSLEDRPGAALETLKKDAFPLDAVIDGKAPATRPEVMHLVRYLCEADGGKLRPKFDEISAKLDRGTKVDAKSFSAVAGPAKKLLPTIRAWLETVQEPWQNLSIEWDSRAADALRGWSKSQIALCRRKAPTSHVSAKLRPLGTGAWKAGVLLRYGGPEDYDIGMIWSNGRIHVDRRSNGAWQTPVEAECPAGEDGAWRVEAVRDGGNVSFVVNATTVGTIEAPPGSMGLAVDSTTVDFTEIQTK